MNVDKLFKRQQEAADKENREKLNRLIPLAEFVLDLLKEDCPMGIIEQKHLESYKAKALKVQQKFLEEDVKWIEREDIFKLAQQALDFVKTMTLDHLDKSFNIASNFLWKGKDMVDITLKDVDGVLKSMKK